MMFELSDSQKEAAFKIGYWYADKSRPIFRLFGYAGTGKTTTIRSIIEQLNLSNSVRFAAYTGKAAMVMRKTGLPAQTIHSLIYKPVAPDTIESNRLAQQIKAETDADKKKELKKELKEKSKVHFTLNEESDLNHIRLLVLDE